MTIVMLAVLSVVLSSVARATKGLPRGASLLGIAVAVLAGVFEADRPWISVALTLILAGFVFSVLRKNGIPNDVA